MWWFGWYRRHHLYALPQHWLNAGQRWKCLVFHGYHSVQTALACQALLFLRKIEIANIFLKSITIIKCCTLTILLERATVYCKLMSTMRVTTYTLDESLFSIHTVVDVDGLMKLRLAWIRKYIHVSVQMTLAPMLVSAQARFIQPVMTVMLLAVIVKLIGHNRHL